MKLIDRDLQILADLALRGDESMRESARALGRQFYTVQRAIEHGVDAGILSRVWLIDPTALGLCRVQCLLSLGYENPNHREKFLKLLQASEDVSFAAEIAGEYDFELVFIGKSELEALRSLEAIIEKSGSSLRQKSLSRQYRITFFRRKHLASPVKKESYLELGAEKGPVEIDEVDRTILAAISTDPNLLKKDLAKVAGVSHLTLERRLSRLKKDKVIVGALWNLRAIELGYQNYKVMITLGNTNDTIREELFSFARDQKHVTNYRENIGYSDVEFGVETIHFPHLAQFKDELLRKFSKNIRTMNIVPRFKIHKFRPYPFRRNLRAPLGSATIV